MRYPLLLIFEREPRVAVVLRDVATEHRWTLREPRSVEACLRFLGQNDASVLVIDAGRDVAPEMRLVERCSALFPKVPTLVVLSSDHPPLANLAWDLGAHVVFGPDQPREHLPEIVAALMDSYHGHGSPAR